jgi:short-subunit dehydrogenase
MQRKIVVITGASAGVGRAIVHRLARAGARLGLIARDAEALAETRAEAERLGAVVECQAIDVSDADAVFKAAAIFREKLGPVDIWINNAMLTVFAPIASITPAEFRRVTEVTYLGSVYGTMAALKEMERGNRGTIIQVGSALAYRGIPMQAAYCGAKHGIRGFLDSLRSELLHQGSNIRVTMMQLPAVNTPQFDWARTRMARQPRPVPPVVQPEVIADAVFKAALNPVREYVIGWSTWKAILGNMLLPGLLDRYLARTAVSGQQTALPLQPGREDNLAVPVRELHRTRGRFGAEAYKSALVIDGQMARLAPVIVGAALLLGAGSLIARRLRAPN